VSTKIDLRARFFKTSSDGIGAVWLLFTREWVAITCLSCFARLPQLDAGRVDVS
jgi:hypothetical protein